MPYMLQPNHPGCAGWAVVNSFTNKLVPGGCHPTKAKAVAHLRALYANVGDDLAAEARAALAAAADATWEGVELLAAGEWDLSTGKASFTTEDLMGAVAACQCPAVGAPILKIGHSDPRFPPRDQDGEPAIGWVGNMRLNATSTKVIGDYTGMPSWLSDILPSAYPKRSVEGQWNFKCQLGHQHPFVITAVALLGVTPPGVGIISSLHDIADLYGVEADATAPPLPVTASSPGAAMPTDPQGAAPLAAGTVTTIDDVRRVFYDSAPWSQWIIEIQLSADGPVLIVSDDSNGQLYRVPVVPGDEGAVEFGAATPVLVSYVDQPARPGGGGGGEGQPAAAGLAFPPGRTVRAAWGSRAASRDGYEPGVPEGVRAAWDAGAAEKNMGDDPSAAQLKAMYALPGDNKSSSKLPHHDCGSDGTVGAPNMTACSAAIGAINGGRGGLVGVSAADKKSAYNHLAAHMRAGGQEPPEFKGAAGEPGPENWPVVDETGEPDNAGELRLGDAGQVEAGLPHGPYTGEHAHAHSAYGAQGSDQTHEHMHKHENDAVHNHVHDPVSAAPTAAATQETGGGSNVDFTTEQLADIAAGLGKDVASLTAADIHQAFAAAKGDGNGDGTGPPRPREGSGMMLVDASVLEDYRSRAQAGDHASEQLRILERDTVLAEAMRVGKFPQSKLAHYQDMWQANPEETRRYVAALAEGMVPVGGPLGRPGLDPDLPGSFEEQTAYRELYPEDVARAKADRRAREREVLGG